MKYILAILLFVSTAQADTFWVARHNVTKKVWLVYTYQPPRCTYRDLKRMGYSVRKEEWRKVKR